MKIAVLSNMTMRTMDTKRGNHEWYFSEYSKFDADVRDAKSDLYKFAPDVILISLHDPDEGLFGIGDLLELLVLQTKAKIFVHNFVFQHERPNRWLHNGKYARILNVNLDSAVFPHEGVQILDLQGLLMEHGRRAMFDSRLYYLAQMPFSEQGMKHVSNQFHSALESMNRKRKKCLVLDLDNTLWDGLLSDGINVGSARRDFQRCIRGWKNSGILLTICSKNDEEQALDALDNHPDMVLKKEDFVAWRINWNDKPSNIREIAEELGVSLDSMVFVDDSDHEIEAVRELLPEVTALKLPPFEEALSQWASQWTWFDTMDITMEDKFRTELYHQEQKRTKAAEGMEYEDFLKSLEIKLDISRVHHITKSRVQQLSERTNQFNMNGNVFRLNEIHEAYTVSYEDKFGNQGIVGAAIIDKGAIVGLYVSCRVLGRGVEQAFISKLYPRPMIVHDTGKNRAAMDFIEDFQEGVPEWIEIESCEL